MRQIINPTLLPWVLAALAVGLVAGLVWLWRVWRRYRARKALRRAVTSVATENLIDVQVPDGMGAGFHVDFLLLSVHGILVMDVRDVAGNIFGGDQMAEWTVMDGPQRFTFINPQNGLYDRVAAVRAITGDVPVEGRVVFTRRGRFPKGLPKWTLMIDALEAEFPFLEAEVQSEVLSRYQQAWERLKSAVQPSAMVHMR